MNSCLKQASYWHNKRFTPGNAVCRVNEGRTRYSVRGDAWQCGPGEVVRVTLWRKLLDVQKICPVCHDLSRRNCLVHMRDIGCHAFREQFVPYA